MADDDAPTRPLSEWEQALFDAYKTTFDSHDGRIVVDHLRDIFVNQKSREVLEDLFGDVPHPYQMYARYGAAVLVDFITRQHAVGDWASYQRNVRLSDPQVPDETGEYDD